ncbi:hypothetical protein UlMin_012095, partial [Ulmus minor]
DLLKHGIPDPSLLTPQSCNPGPDKDSKDKAHEVGEYMAVLVFVHTKLQDQDLNMQNSVHLTKAIAHYLSNSSFFERETLIYYAEHLKPSLFVFPLKNNDDTPKYQYESYTSMLWKLLDHVLSMNHLSFSRTMSEWDWLKNSAKIWETVKNSPIIAEYCKTLQNFDLLRR